MISLENVSKKFGTGVFAITDVSFSVEKGEFIFLVGPTGSGKTTIFRLLIREMIPSSGTIVVSSWDLVKLPSKKIPDLRKKIGVVFQDLKLLNDRTVIENVMLPLEVAGMKPKEAVARTEEVLNQVGILEHRDKFPVQLSGGELQRTAIARALILSPEILLADEPTGNLDDVTAFEIVKLLSDINEKGTTILMATHNKEIVRKLNKRIIELNKGSVIDDKKHVKSDKEHKKEEHEEKPPDKVMNGKEEHEEKAEKKKEHHEEKEAVEPKEEELKTDEFEEALKKE